MLLNCHCPYEEVEELCDSMMLPGPCPFFLSEIPSSFFRRVFFGNCIQGLGSEPSKKGVVVRLERNHKHFAIFFSRLCPPARTGCTGFAPACSLVAGRAARREEVSIRGFIVQGSDLAGFVFMATVNGFLVRLPLLYVVDKESGNLQDGDLPSYTNGTSEREQANHAHHWP